MKNKCQRIEILVIYSLFRRAAQKQTFNAPRHVAQAKGGCMKLRPTSKRQIVNADFFEVVEPHLNSIMLTGSKKMNFFDSFPKNVPSVERSTTASRVLRAKQID